MPNCSLYCSNDTFRIIPVYAGVFFIKIDINSTILNVLSNFNCGCFITFLVTYEDTNACTWGI